ncbi:hypothetical protein HPB47_024744 [Ixodes persulcatus]|uniref:Uncharacterized protein n=1 Tax=Ixodes persulcatus TaxID=34615 RepID=A0AC60Q3X4_IXOPE|nr:hypothetical protein HPB47_024744 [Ixodes persulcatus]
MMSSGARRGFSVCREPRLNSLCCVWYCTAALALSIYIVAGSVQRFTRYMALPWPPRDQPYVELNAYVGCIGAAVVLLPFFVASAMLQVGNLANDGGRLLWPLGVHGGPDAVYENLPDRRRQRSRWRSWLKALWRHGGPTAPTLHVWSAFCLLLPRMLVQGRLIRHGFLRKTLAPGAKERNEVPGKRHRVRRPIGNPLERKNYPRSADSTFFRLSPFEANHAPTRLTRSLFLVKSDIDYTTSDRKCYSRGLKASRERRSADTV